MSLFRMTTIRGTVFGEGETVEACREDARKCLHEHHGAKDAKAWTDAVLVCEGVDEAVEEGNRCALIIVNDEVYRALPEGVLQ